MVPRTHVSLVSAWLAREGHTILTAPVSLVKKALNSLGVVTQ